MPPKMYIVNGTLIKRGRNTYLKCIQIILFNIHFKKMFTFDIFCLFLNNNNNPRPDFLRRAFLKAFVWERVVN